MTILQLTFESFSEIKNAGKHWTEALPKLLEQNNGKLKIWSAACAAGEEPYTLSLILSKHLAPFRYDIQATDLDFHVLETAKRGQYTERSLKELPNDF